MKKNEQSFRDLWDYNRRSNICVITVMEGERKREAENLVEEMAKNFPNLTRDKNLQVQEAEKTTKDKPQKSMPRHMLIELLNTKDKGKNPESSRRKTTRMIGDFLSETVEARKKWLIFHMLKAKVKKSCYVILLLASSVPKNGSEETCFYHICHNTDSNLSFVQFFKLQIVECLLYYLVNLGGLFFFIPRF